MDMFAVRWLLSRQIRIQIARSDAPKPR
jgi:hypothetical protein